MSSAAVIFDMDGVVVDSHPAHLAAWQAVLAIEKRNVSRTDLGFIFDGRRRDEILVHFFGRISSADAERVGRLKDKMFWERRDMLRLTPGFIDFLDDIEHHGIKTAVATSASRDRAMKTLSFFGLCSRFGTIVTGDDVSAGKPDPALFMTAANRLGFAPGDCVVVEDAVAGIQAAKAACMRCIAIVSRPELRTKLVREGPDKVRKDFRRMSAGIIEEVIGRNCGNGEFGR